MKKYLISGILLLVVILIIITFAINHQQRKLSFLQFIQKAEQEAIALGISKKTVEKYLSDLKLLEPIQKTVVIKRETHQAQAILNFQQYIKRLIPKNKIKKAREEYQRHRILLLEIYRQYNVQPRFIIALWGLESNFGEDTGHFPLIESLAMLSYRHHRSRFYRRQLIDALKILDHPAVIPPMLLSSFDGGMGQPQFEPAAYLRYAVDFDHDGFANIWTNLPDVFASIANFLHLNGWDGSQSWGIEVKIPKNFPTKLANEHIEYSIQKWNSLEVRNLDGSKLKNIKGNAAILLPSGITGPAFLVYPNFKVLLRWNDTTFESLTAGVFSDKLVVI